MINSIRPHHKFTPEDFPCFSPPDPRSRRIKTIVKHSTQSKEFDAEVNEAIKDGWTLDELKITSSDSFIILFARLSRYETECEKTLNEKRADIGLPPIEQEMRDIIHKELKEYHENTKTSGAGEVL